MRNNNIATEDKRKDSNFNDFMYTYVYSIHSIQIQSRISETLFRDMIEICIKLKYRNRSQCIRELLKIAVATLKGVKNIESEHITLNISNLNINFNTNANESRDTGKDIDPEILKRDIKILRDENSRLRKQIEYYENEYNKCVNSVKSLKSEIDMIRRECGRQPDVKIVVDNDKIASSLDIIIDSIKENRIDQALEWLQNLNKMLKEKRGL